jgi:hypothetical protein
MSSSEEFSEDSNLSGTEQESSESDFEEFSSGSDEQEDSDDSESGEIESGEEQEADVSSESEPEEEQSDEESEPEEIVVQETITPPPSWSEKIIKLQGKKAVKVKQGIIIEKKVPSSIRDSNLKKGQKEKYYTSGKSLNKRVEIGYSEHPLIYDSRRVLQKEIYDRGNIDRIAADTLSRILIDKLMYGNLVYEGTDEFLPKVLDLPTI